MMVRLYFKRVTILIALRHQKCYVYWFTEVYNAGSWPGVMNELEDPKLAA